ncbi:MAG: hypothetical protein V2A79_10095 [Planctomycetota bacterium]
MTDTAATTVADTAADGQTGETWHAQHEYFRANPEAVKSFAKFKDEDASFKDHHHLMQRLGKPYHLPDGPGKLTKEQTAEIETWDRKRRGVPETPEGYEIEVPEDVLVDEEGMTEFRKLAHERGVDPKTVQDLLNVQVGLVRRLNAHREKVIQGMTDNNYKTFLNEDCGGDKDLAASRLTLVKQYLQGQFTKDGKIDTAGWEKFAARIMHGDRLIELPLLRALYEAALMKMGTGGAPGPSGGPVLGGGNLYAEMREKK